jgi:hypothetical protein
MPNHTKQQNNRVKTTVLIDKNLKKLAQVYAIQNEMTLGELIEEALEQSILEKSK